MYDAAWMAGFFDGEGSVSIVKYKPSGKRSIRYCLETGVANTELSLVEPFLQTFGGHVAVDTNDRWKTCFKWKTTSRKAVRFLEYIEPYVRSARKRRCIKLAVQFQANQRRGAGRSNQFIKRPSVFPPGYRAKQEKLWKQMRELNLRGKASQ